MAKLAILCDGDPSKKPRPARLIEMLKKEHSLFVFGKDFLPMEGVKNFSFPPAKSASQRTLQEEENLQNALKSQKFDSVLFTPNRLVLRKMLLECPTLELLIVEDITLLPFAIEYKEKFKSCKVMIDLREFYPLEYENDSAWLQGFGKFFEFLCRVYLPRVDFALCVSEGIAKRYLRDYGIQCELLLSLPPYFALSPSQNTQIELIYHGFISADRESENLLEIAKSLREGITLNLIALSNQPSFLQDFLQEVQKLPNIKLHSPVALNKIIPFTNQFDLGLLTLKPNGFNNANALPNKFFEYIQARLGVICTPLPSVKPLIDKWGIGRYASSFDTQDLIELLNALTKEEIMEFKNRSNEASVILNLRQNQEKILKFIETLKGKK